jgi:endoglucanase
MEEENMLTVKKNIKKAVTLFLCTTLLTTSIISTSSVSVSAAGYDYSLVLKNAIGFYDANKCGKDVAKNNVFDWRGACHTNDGSDVGVDLTGGYHDAGDHVKFGLPQGYTAAVLGWSLYEFGDVFQASGNKTKMLEQLKYFTDYFLKSHPNSNTFYYQVGDGEADHQYWGPPETQPGDRPTKCVANASSPASDVLGETTAALALMYLNYKDIDSTYANNCLKAAKELYTMATTNKGLGDGQYFYRSTSIYDDLAWGAVWLNVATGESSYLDDAKEFILIRNENGNDPLQHRWTMCWDDMYIPGLVMLARLTNDDMYKKGVEYNLDYWMNDLETTPGGLKFLNYWGVLRYASAASMIASIYYKQNPNPKYLEMAKKQIDYCLGDNPENMSYVVGMGSKWSVHPHHRAAQGAVGYADGANLAEAKYVLLGALIGGPDNKDVFKDSVSEFQYTEVAIDYNAGFVGAVAAVAKHFGNLSIPTAANTPAKTPTPVITSTPSGPAKVMGDVNSDGIFNAIDFALARQKLIAIPITGIFDMSVADVNGDGNFNAIDFALMRQKLLGLIINFPAE